MSIRRIFSAVVAGLVFTVILSAQEAGEGAPVSDNEVFGVFSETLPMGVEWGKNVTTEIWRGMILSNDTRDYAEGSHSWKFTAQGQTWLGMGVKVFPVKNYVDMNAFTNGSLNFLYKGTAGFKVGIKSGTNTESWLFSSALEDFGFAADNRWQEIKIPLSLFSGIDFTNISYFFMFASDSSRGLIPNLSYRVDNIHWSKYYSGPRKIRVVQTNFGIYSDTVEVAIQWDSDTKLDIWSDHHGNAKVVDLVKGAGEGMNAWRIIGTGRWAGIGIRPHPARTTRDMSEYKNGTLRFMYKGGRAFRVGIKSGTSAEFWFTATNMAKYGYIEGATNWREVILPLSACTNIDFTKISQYFMWNTDEDDYNKGAVYYLDGIYWSKINPYAPVKPAARKPAVRRKK